MRATAPYDLGLVDAQKSVLGGVRVEMRFSRAHFYADFLAGRGRLTFNRPYTLPDTGAQLRSQPDTDVFSPGVGVRFDLSRNLAAFGDVQIQHWDTPASLSGHLFSKPVTAGLVYRFAYTHHGGPGR